MGIAAKYKAGPTKAIGALTGDVDKLNEALNPLSDYSKQKGQIPFFQTGARALIRLGGIPLAVCTDINWRVEYAATPIFTIDSNFPWDIDVGAATINASLNSIMDPTKGPEADLLFHIMQSAIHQPYAELQVLDKLGTSMFFARGMFLGITGHVARGQVSTWGATFTGVAYQHYVNHFAFKPYNTIAGKTSALLGGLKGLASDLTGGIL
jgi:hypothetical protein